MLLTLLQATRPAGWGRHAYFASELELPDHLTTNPPVPIGSYRDSFGNWCSRLVAPRYAADVPLTHILGSDELRGLQVWTDEAIGPSS